MTEKIKTCTRCHQPKPFSDFKSDSRKPDGKASSCKACNAAPKELKAVMGPVEIRAFIDQITETWKRGLAASAEARALIARKPSKELTNIELPLSKKLEERFGPAVRRQVSCPGGRIDILTPEEIIECKATGDAQSLFDAAKQLKRYEPHFPKRELWIAVPHVQKDAEWLRTAFWAVSIFILELDFEP